MARAYSMLCDLCCYSDRGDASASSTGSFHSGSGGRCACEGLAPWHRKHFRNFSLSSVNTPTTHSLQARSGCRISVATATVSGLGACIQPLSTLRYILFCRFLAMFVLLELICIIFDVRGCACITIGCCSGSALASVQQRLSTRSFLKSK